ncbi:MAG: M14 family zinc carboxypeptidase, partial [Candidatus Latescibacteria bacterium]|nr:M14 family zinc carboxypeptidase [Candidatus Latescibacterota bacterium]
PQSQEGVLNEGHNRFRIFPSWRPSPGISEEAVGRSTRLGFRVANPIRQPERVVLSVDWQFDDAPEDATKWDSREGFMSLRDFVVVQGPDEEGWRTVMGDTDGSVARFEMEVEPGETEIHWHPPYTYSQNEAAVQALRDHPFVDVDKTGASEGGRNLWILRITDASSQPKVPALIIDRYHAYESASSYAREGMVDWLLGDDPWALSAIRKHAFHVIPLANPDGVANGMGRLTAPQGADLVFYPPTEDSAHRTIVSAIDRVKPGLFVQLHNWQNKQTDGLLGLDPEIRDHFLKFMPDQVGSGKQWSIKDPSPVPIEPPPRELMGAYCRRVHGTVSVSFEFPWFGRTPDDVRETGRKALWAMLQALDRVGEGLSTR